MKALVLGAGEMGREAIVDLVHYGPFDEVTVGTRRIEPILSMARELSGSTTRVRPVRVDLDREDELPALFDQFDVVVNCAGPNFRYELPVARAAIAARVHLVDLNDEWETTLQMLALDQAARAAGITVVMGLGASPGVNNVLARAAANQLDVVEEIHTAWVMSGPDPGGPALAQHLLYSLSGKALTFTGGELVEVESFTDGRRSVRFPAPIGRMDVFHVGHPEPITLSRTFPEAREVSDRATFNPPRVNDLIRRLGALVRDAPGPVLVGEAQVDPMAFAAGWLRQSCVAIGGAPLEGALHVEVVGRVRARPRKVCFSSVGRIARGTGIPAAIGAIMLAEGDVDARGVLPPEACIDANDFIFEIVGRRQVAELNGWIEE